MPLLPFYSKNGETLLALAHSLQFYQDVIVRDCDEEMADNLNKIVKLDFATAKLLINQECGAGNARAYTFLRDQHSNELAEAYRYGLSELYGSGLVDSILSEVLNQPAQ